MESMKKYFNLLILFSLSIVFTSCTTPNSLNDALTQGVRFLVPPELEFIKSKSPYAKKGGLLRQGDVYTTTQRTIVGDRVEGVEVRLYKYDNYLFYSIGEGCIYHISPEKSDARSVTGYKIPVLMDGVSIGGEHFRCSMFRKALEPYHNYAKVGVTKIEKLNNNTIALINVPLDDSGKIAIVELHKEEL